MRFYFLYNFGYILNFYFNNVLQMSNTFPYLCSKKPKKVFFKSFWALFLPNDEFLIFQT